jgi:hypothetical protein
VAQSSAATPISYRRTIRDSAGVRHRINFSGLADGGRLSGVLTLDGDTIDIVAQIGKDGSLSGKLAGRASGEEGSFWGVFDQAQLLGGRFNLGAQGGEWTAPDFAIPAGALPTSDEVVVSQP